MVEQRIVIPLDVFLMPHKGKLSYITLNPWNELQGLRNGKGRAKASKYKKMIEARIRHYAEQAMVDGVTLASDEPLAMSYEWYLRNKRIDLDNWSFTQKMILDAFQGTTVRGDVLLADDGIKYVQENHHYFCGVDTDNPRVEVTWRPARGV